MRRPTGTRRAVSRAAPTFRSARPGAPKRVPGACRADGPARDVQTRLTPLLAELTGRTIFMTHKGVLRALYSLAAGWDMRSKAPHRLAEGCAHAFRVAPGGSLAIRELNI